MVLLFSWVAIDPFLNFETLNLVEVVSKPQIRFKGKAQADRESAAYKKGYVSIYRKSAT
jgi:hypothetical protein